MSRQAKIYLLALAAFAGGLYLLSDVLTPFLLGMAIAYVLDPLCDRLEARGHSRTRATAIVTGAFFLVAGAALAVAVPLIWSQAMTLVANAPAFVEEARTLVRPIWSDVAPHLTPELADRVETAAQAFAGTAAGWLGSALQATISGSLAVVDLISTLLITPLVAFFMIRDWDHLIAAIDRRIPRQMVDTVRSRCREINDVLAAWMRGVATVCVVLGAFYALSLSALGLAHGLLIGLAAGAVSFVPFVGFFLGGALAMVSALLTFSDPWMWAATAAVFAVGQAAEGNFLTPRLVGRNVDLHEVWVIFALMAGGSLFGFTGVLLAIPVTAALGVLVRAADARYLASTLYDPGAAKTDTATTTRTQIPEETHENGNRAA